MENKHKTKVFQKKLEKYIDEKDGDEADFLISEAHSSLHRMSDEIDMIREKAFLAGCESVYDEVEETKIYLAKESKYFENKFRMEQDTNAGLEERILRLTHCLDCASMDGCPHVGTDSWCGVKLVGHNV